MGYRAHHHTKPLTPTLRAVARIPLAPPLAAAQATAAGAAQSLALQPVGTPRRAGPLTLGGRADRFYRPMVAPKWCRWGYFNEAGNELTVTRIM